MVERLRVAMISLHTNPLAQPGVGNAGGMNVYVRQLAASLAQLGVEVELFTRLDSAPLSSDTLALGADNSSVLPIVTEVSPGVRLWQIPTQNQGEIPKEELYAELESFSARVWEVIQGFGKDWVQLIHSHYWLSGLSGIELAALLQVPLVHAMHTMGRTKNAALAPGDRPEPLSRLLGETEIAQKANALIAATPHEAHELETHYGANPAKVVVIPPGVDRSVFKPGLAQAHYRTVLDFAGLNIPAAAKVILFAGRIQRLKNPGVLVRALAADGQIPPDTYLVILGGASGHFTSSIDESELAKLAERLGVADRVRILAPVPPARLADWYRAADVVAVPSYSESYGLVAAEAIASGTPVVAAQVGGLATIVDDGVTGRFVASHDPEDWALVLGDVLSDVIERAKLAAACRSESRLFGWDRTAAETLALYRALIPESYD